MMYRTQQQPKQLHLSLKFLIGQPVPIRCLDEQEGGLVEERDGELEEGPVDEEEGVEEGQV